MSLMERDHWYYILADFSFLRCSLISQNASCFTHNWTILHVPIDISASHNFVAVPC